MSLLRWLTSIGAGADSIYAQQGLPGLRVRVVGELQSTPALPAGGAFMVLPRSAVGTVHAVNLMLLDGPSINMTRLRAAASSHGQRRAAHHHPVGRAAVEVLPAITAAAVAAIACAIALPQVVAPALNLSVFAKSQVPVPLRPDVASVVLPLAGLVLVTIIALGYEIRSRRRRGVAVTMRAS